MKKRRARDPEGDARRRIAKAAEAHAHALTLKIGRPANEAPRPWLEAADAFEVAADAWREAGEDDLAQNADNHAQNIIAVIRIAYKVPDTLARRMERWELRRETAFPRGRR